MNTIIHRKHFSENNYYFLFFIIVSILYIVNGYASLSTNDDWALRSMLFTKGVYGTLIMSYPLSYIMSHLYDWFPSFPWYSSLLTLVMGLNFYVISRYIATVDSYIQKFILFILSLLGMTFLWFNLSITVLTMTTMIVAVGLIKTNLRMSFFFIFLASLLRTDIVLMFIPYYTVSYFILKTNLSLYKNELFALILLILLVSSSIFIEKQDKLYTEWLAFNKARSAIVDTGMLNVTKDFFSPHELFCIQSGWFQDPELLPTKKMIVTTPSFVDIYLNIFPHVDFLNFLKTYKFKYWIWLLLLISLLIIILQRNYRKSIAILGFILGIFLLIMIRNVDRVIIPLILLGAYLLFENLKSYRKVSILFLFLFTELFFYYISEHLGYRYFKEITSAKQEARQLIKSSHKACEVSLNYPTNSNANLSTIFLYNFLFREDTWLKINDTEILPTGWLSRHPIFYRTHHMSDAYTTRKHATYYDYLIDENTAFIGGKMLINYEGFNIYLLGTYDKLYLKDRPHCKHRPYIIAESEHFTIAQIRIDCNNTKSEVVK